MKIKFRTFFCFCAQRKFPIALFGSILGVGWYLSWFDTRQVFRGNGIETKKGVASSTYRKANTTNTTYEVLSLDLPVANATANATTTTTTNYRTENVTTIGTNETPSLELATNNFTTPATTVFLPDAEPILDPHSILKYASFHRSQFEERDGIWSIKPEAKSLVYQCHNNCGGAGDRVKGIITSLYLAICSNRVLFVDAPFPDDLQNYLTPNRIRWNSTLPKTRDITLIQGIDQIKTKMAMHNPEKYLQTPQPARVDIRANQFIMQFKQEIQQTSAEAKKSPCLQALFKQDHDEIYSEYFSALFRFSDAVKKRSKLHLQTAGMQHVDDRKYVAVHVRMGDYKIGGNHVRYPNSTDTIDKFYNCTKKLQDGLEPCLGYRPAAYVASDDNEIKQSILQKDNSSTPSLHGMNMEILHVDSGRSQQLKNAKEAHLNVWAEINTLVDAYCLVRSRSGFSDIGALAGTQPRCAVKINECTDEDVAKALANVGCSA